VKPETKIYSIPPTNLSTSTSSKESRKSLDTKRNQWGVGTTHCQLGKAHGSQPVGRDSVSEVGGKRFTRLLDRRGVKAPGYWVRGPLLRYNSFPQVSQTVTSPPFLQLVFLIDSYRSLSPPPPRSTSRHPHCHIWTHL